MCYPSNCQLLNKTSHSTFFDLTFDKSVAQLNLIILPGGGHRSSQGNEGIFVENTFFQLFSISAFARYVGMLSSASA